MDIRLPDRSGVEACREIRSADPNVQIIMLTSHADEEAVFNSIIAGASGYLLKEMRGEELVRAVETVATGQSLLDPAVTQKVLEKMKRMVMGLQPDELAQLSAQEQKVLALVAEGKTNKEIARALGLSDKTVKNYLSPLLSKIALAELYLGQHTIRSKACFGLPDPPRMAEKWPSGLFLTVRSGLEGESLILDSICMGLET